MQFQVNWKEDCGAGTSTVRRVTRVVLMPGERHDIVRPATLMIEAQRQGTGEAHRDAVVNQERQRCAHARHDQAIFARQC